MFGYIRIFKPELTFREYEQYRGIYCSLCDALGRRYGLSSRMTLSYDFTFLSMFRMALSDTQPSFREGRCPFRPTKKRAFCCDDTDSISYSADVAVLLTYHKLSDTICDERGLKKAGAFLARMLLGRDYKKAVARRPQESVWAQEFMEAQAVTERENHDSVDAAAHPTATFLAKLASADIVDEVERDIAWRFGYGLGRFIYLCDAVEDIAEDEKHHRYNVFLRQFPQALQNHVVSNSVADYMKETLHQTVAVCTECYEQLTVYHFDSIMRNILYGGMPATIHQIHHRSQKENPIHEESLRNSRRDTDRK